MTKMIKLSGLTKYYPSNQGRQYVFENLNFEFPNEGNIALLGANGAGKSTLFRIIAGSEYPDRGQVITSKNISWPVALASGIHPQMTGRENTRFIGRVNGISELDAYEEKVKDFAELGNKYELPVKSYSSGMRSRLAFGCCVAIDFDVYLIDEATSVGDQKFKKKARKYLLDKSEESNLIMVSHDLKEIREFCDRAVVLRSGKLQYYDDLEDAINYYSSL